MGKLHGEFHLLNPPLNYIVDPKIKTNEGLTALHYAARYVPVIHEEDTDAGAEGKEKAVTLSSTSKQIMMLLVIQYQVDVNVTDAYNLTPLHLACSRGNRGAVEVLLESKRVDVNAKDKQLNTPLHAACRLGDSWIVEQLLASGADVLISNDERSTVLHIACLMGSSDIVKIILQKNFEDRARLLSDTDNELNTPLHLACECGEVEILHILFLNGADPHLTKLHGISPLHLAAKEGFTDAADVMLQYKVSIDVRDIELQTPLHYAARYNQEEVITFLLDK